MRHIELSEAESALWNETCQKAAELRAWKRALGRSIWQDSQTDVAVVAVNQQIVWSLVDQGARVLMTQTVKNKTHVAVYDKSASRLQGVVDPGRNFYLLQNKVAEPKNEFTSDFHKLLQWEQT